MNAGIITGMLIMVGRWDGGAETEQQQQMLKECDNNRVGGGLQEQRGWTSGWMTGETKLGCISGYREEQ